jgi:4-hydroxy-tetrahydrodipicolinate reductase
MINVLLCGCNGKMGKFIRELMAERQDMQIAAGVDVVRDDIPAKFPVFQTIAEVTVKSDVIIDFTHHSLTPSVLDYVEKTQIPAVICTTGLDEAIISRMKAMAQTVPLLRSGNMSLGINLLLDLVQRAATVLEGFDIEVIERHHNQKLDAPSGTAYMLAEAINQVLDNSKTFTYGREGKDAKRQPQEIGIHAIRGGTLVGEHEIIFAGNDEIVTISHSARSRKVFGKGAIQAARFLVSQPPGLYSMKDVLA